LEIERLFPSSKSAGRRYDRSLSEENPNDARIIVQQFQEAAASSRAKKAREMVQRKTVMGGGGLRCPSDCSEQDPAKREVYLVEEIWQVVDKHARPVLFAYFAITW
jgi:DNA gyrase subunit B